ncbi:MAG: ABC transporter permease [Phycisphaerales bacterium]|nr:ABC transporter permease [Phycisphaerales bacterium]
MSIQLSIAVTQLISRRRPTLVSLGGIALGVAFFLAVSSLMRGSERDFITRLIDNSPHITVSDEYRKAQPQPVNTLWPNAAIELRRVKPLTEVRGIRGHAQKLAFIETLPSLRVAPVLVGSVVLSFAGRNEGVTLNGVVPAKMKGVSTIEEKMREGSLEALTTNPNGLIIGEGLAKKFGLSMGNMVNAASPNGEVRTLKVVGIFRTGNASYDENQTFALLKRVQGLLDRANRVNRFIIQLDDPYAAREVATVIERQIGYKAVSWQESAEDLMSVLLVRNLIMYSVVSAILVVASFGIYNTISTIVMEKIQDIAILKSMGFHARDIRHIFLAEGLILGVLGSLFGVSLGLGLMWLLAQVEIKPPGASELVHLPIYWGWEQYGLAAGFALASAIGAAYLPARKAGRVQPVAILRGLA